MDDRELEGRLSAHLHRRFDDARLPAGLEAAVLQGMRTTPRPIPFDLRSRRLTLGWSVVAAAVVLVAGFLLFGSFNPSAGPRATPSPTASAADATRSFIVLPPTSALPSKASGSLASDVLEARVRALGVGTFTSAIGNLMQFQLPADGPTDAVVRRVLAATGEVSFVPLPAEDYGEGKRTATVGEALPKAEPALFGWEGISAVTLRADAPSPTFDIALKPAAATAFGDYTTAHVGATFAVVIDGAVALLPSINEPLTSGQIALSSGGGDTDFQVTAAILVGGPLPEEWRGAPVPAIKSRDEAIADARASMVRSGVEGAAEATVVSAELDATHGDAGWSPIWTVVFDRASNGPMQVIVDAARGS